MPKRPRSASSSPDLSRPSSPSFTPDTPSPASNTIAAPLHSSKYRQTSDEAQTRAVMRCSLPPHTETLVFSTFEEFEVHYAKVHAYRCSECRRNFPTEHFLGLHISENHDPLEDARRANDEKTYRCFVQDCDKICSTPQKRRMHLVDKHMFPKNYDFLIVNAGIDKRSSMLRSRHRRPSSAAYRAFHRDQRSNEVENSSHEDPNAAMANKSLAAETSKTDDLVSKEKPSPDADVDELTSTMSALKFVPPSIRFGRGGRRGGLSRS